MVALGLTLAREIPVRDFFAWIKLIVAFEGRGLKNVVARRFLKGSNISNMAQRIRVENDDVVHIKLLPAPSLWWPHWRLGELPWEALLPRGITSQPKRWVGVQNVVKGTVYLCAVIWWKGEAKTNRCCWVPWNWHGNLNSIRSFWKNNNRDRLRQGWLLN